MQAILTPVLIVTLIGIISGVILTVAAKYMAVPVDERVQNVRECLPGANCGACGFAGCDEYAQKMVEEGAKTNLCTPGGSDVVQKVSALLGVEAEAVVPMRAVVKCAGTCENTKYVMDYQGPQSCAACKTFFRGRGSCSHSCLGYGDCVLVCQYGAISIENGIAVVDRELCTGCGMCEKACPNSVVAIIPQTSNAYVACSSTDRGALVRKVCTAGCIGCKKCEKACEQGAITITDNLASIDPQKCTNCGVCVAECPTHIICLASCAVMQR